MRKPLLGAHPFKLTRRQGLKGVAASLQVDSLATSGKMAHISFRINGPTMSI